MTRARAALAAILAGALLSGCVAAPPAALVEDRPMPPPAKKPEPVPDLAPPPAPPQIRVSDADRLLYYYEYITGLPAEQLARELERTQRFFGQHRSDFALMQLVLLKTLPGAAPKERAQAQDTLAQYLKENRDRPSEFRPLALMINTMLAEQLRQEAELQSQALRLKDEARRSEELKQKLEALVETERKMLERKQPTRKE
jgi:hypothetical protein